MKDNDCSICGKDIETIINEAYAHTILRSPHTGTRICSTCVKSLNRCVMATEQALLEAAEENEKARADGIVLNENGECMCLRHIFERKKDAIERTNFAATETTGTRH